MPMLLNTPDEVNVSEKRVFDYIEQHFNLSCFEVLDFPLMPGGKTLRDKNRDELLFHHDILTDTIKYKPLNCVYYLPDEFPVGYRAKPTAVGRRKPIIL